LEVEVEVGVGVEVEVVSMGRSGVDIYPLQSGVGLEDVETFGKFLGGSPTNVAVAVARLGHSVVALTGVGNDSFGRFVQREMVRLGVADDYVVTSADLATPVTFCELFPPDNFPLYFYRQPSAPDLQLRAGELPLEVIQSAKLLWMSGTGLSQEPSRSAHHAALAARDRAPNTILDLDYRPIFWASAEQATEQVSRCLGQITVALGNRQECQVAVGETEPDRAADALLAAGVEIAIVKQGPAGTLAKTHDERIVVPPFPIEVVNGLGAGDAFGGTVCHGLLSGWSLRRIITGASAAGAIVASRLECSTAMPTIDEIEAVLAGTSVADVNKAQRKEQAG